MSLQQIIQCAPFRLSQPRALTRYETAVVTEAVRMGYADVQVAAPGYEVSSLVAAMMQQAHCPAWRSSVFGPAPAVSTYAYRCFAAWFARLDTLSKTRAMQDIVTKGLLCGLNGTSWGSGSCPSVAFVGGNAQQLWEGAPQQGGAPRSGDEACAFHRQRIAYMPMTGEEMLQIFELYGGQLPPQLAQAKQYGQPFMKRSFLVGVEARPASLANIGSDPLAVARALTEDVALIWAPGKGASIKFLLDQPLDGAKLNALLQAMMPDMLPDLLGQLPQLIPGLIPPPDDPIWGTLGGLLTPMVPRAAAAVGPQPQTPPTTGTPVVDKPGSQLPTNPPWPELGGSFRVGLGLLAFAAATALVYMALRR